MTLHPTREAWLEEATRLLWPIFPYPKTEEPPDPILCPWPRIKVSVGWPKGGRGGHTRGQCWSATLSGDATTGHIFVGPQLDDVAEVLAVLAHELVHALVGTEEKHKGKFVKVASYIGLLKPWKTATPSAGLSEKLAEVARELGDYPHVKLNPMEQKKQTARQLLYRCQHGKRVRAAAQDPLNAVCQDCGTKFERVNP